MIRKNTQRKTNEAEINFRLNPTIIRKDIDILQAQVAYLLKLREKQFDAGNYYTKQTIDSRLDALEKSIAGIKYDISEIPTTVTDVEAKIKEILTSYGISTGETYYTAEQISELLTAENLYKILNPVGNAELDWDVYAEENPEMGVSSAIIYEYLRNYSYYTQAYIDDVFVKNSDIITYSYVAEDGTPLNIEYMEEDENVIKYTYSLQIDKESGLASKISTTTDSEGNSTNSYKLSIIAGAGITTEDISETEKSDYYIDDSDTQKKLTINAGKCLTVEKSEETTGENDEGVATTTSTGEHKLNVVCSSSGGIGGGVIYNETDGTYSFDKNAEKTGLYIKMSSSSGITTTESGFSVSVADPLYTDDNGINLRVRTPLYIEDSSTTTATNYALNLYYSAPITLTNSNLSLSLSDVFYVDSNNALNLYYSAPITLTNSNLSLSLSDVFYVDSNNALNLYYSAPITLNSLYNTIEVFYINLIYEESKISVNVSETYENGTKTSSTNDDYTIKQELTNIYGSHTINIIQAGGITYLTIILSYISHPNKYTANILLYNATLYQNLNLTLSVNDDETEWEFTTETNSEPFLKYTYTIAKENYGDALALNYSSPLSVSGNNLALNYSSPLSVSGNNLALNYSSPLYIDEEKTYNDVEYILTIYNTDDSSDYIQYKYTTEYTILTSDYIITYTENDYTGEASPAMQYIINVSDTDNFNYCTIRMLASANEYTEGSLIYTTIQKINDSSSYSTSKTINAKITFTDDNITFNAIIDDETTTTPSPYKIELTRTTIITTYSGNNLNINIGNNTDATTINSISLYNGLSVSPLNGNLCVLFDSSFAKVTTLTAEDNRTYYYVTKAS